METDVEDLHLTEEQMEVLKASKECSYQLKAARKVGKSKQNFNQILKRAKENIRKSRKTLEWAKNNGLDEV